MLNDRLTFKMQREEKQEEKLSRWIGEEQVRRYKERERKKREDEREMERLQQQLLNDDGQPLDSVPLSQVTLLSSLFWRARLALT